MVGGLADEALRWKETVAVLEVDLVNLVGNILSLPMYPEISSEQLEMIFNSTAF